MARELDEDELIGNWTLVGDELQELSGRRGATKLGFALLLRFYAVHGRFPSGRSELPDQAVAHVARLVDVPASDLGFYEWDGRTVKAHRADIRRYFGFRECSVADADKAADWLAANVCEKERQADRVREELLAYLQRERVEPPSRDRVRRVVGAALRQAEQALTARLAGRVPAEATGRMRALIARSADPGGEEGAGAGDDGTLFGAAVVTGVDVFAAIRDEPGNVSVKTIGQEAFKLGVIHAVGLPGDLFADVAPKVLAGWRARVAAEAPSHLRSHPPEIMVTLLAAYLYCRQREITDALADLLIATVHRINARADTKVTKDFVAELKRVSGKENILFKMTEAAAAAAGDLDRAERIARSLTRPDEQAQALAGVATAAAAAGDLDRARELAADAERIARSLTSSYAQARALAGVATAAAAGGDLDGAERIARSLTDPDEQARALAGVATAAAAAGDLDRARELAADAERIARSITSPNEQAQALARVASSAAELVRARSCIAGALTAGRWTILLQALALVDPAALSAFAGELTAPSDPSQTQDNGLLSGTSARHNPGRAAGPGRRRLRDSRTLSGTSPAARRRRHGRAAGQPPPGGPRPVTSARTPAAPAWATTASGSCSRSTPPPPPAAAWTSTSSVTPPRPTSATRRSRCS